VRGYNLLSTWVFSSKSRPQGSPQLVWLARLRAVVASRVRVPLGMQTRFELYTGGKGLGFWVWLGPSRLGPLRRNASRGVNAACSLFTAGHRLLAVGGILQAAGCCQSHLAQAVCSQQKAAVSRLQHTTLMGKQVLDADCVW